MSWRYSAWAKEQRVGSPHGKSVLLCIGDGANHHTGVLYDSQAQIAEAAEVDERTVREWLGRFERWGLVRRERRKRADGYRDSDMIVCQPDVFISNGKELISAEKGGDSAETLPEAVSGKVSESYRKRVQTLPEAHADLTGSPRRCIEPSSNQDITENLRESAGENAGEEEALNCDEPDERDITKQFWVFVKDWPNFAGMPKEAALKAWKRTSREDRELALARRDDWFALLKRQHRSHIPAPSTYLGERLFADVAAPEPVAQMAPPFGPAWMAERIERIKAVVPVLRFTAFEEMALRDGKLDRAALEAGKRLSARTAALAFMDERASRGIGMTPSPSAKLAAAGFEPVPVGTPAFEAWKQEFEQRGWPWLPDMGRMAVAYFPKRNEVV